MSRYTIEWANGPLPEGTELYTSPQPPKQEPAGSVYRYGKDSSGTPWHGILWTASGLDLPDGTLIYTSPPAQRKPLTDKEIADIATSHPLTWVNLNTVEHRRYFARAIEAAHGIKENT